MEYDRLWPHSARGAKEIAFIIRAFLDHFHRSNHDFGLPICQVLRRLLAPLSCVELMHCHSSSHNIACCIVLHLQ